MVQEARAVKLQKEAEMRQEWLQGNGYYSQVPLHNFNVGLRALYFSNTEPDLCQYQGDAQV